MKPSVSDPRRSRKQRHFRYAVFVFTLVVLASYICVLPVFGTGLLAYLHIDDATFGLMFSIGPLASIAVALVTGPLIDRLGAIRMIRYSLWSLALGMTLLALCGTSWILMTLGLVVCTSGSIWLSMVANRYVTQLFPRDRRRIMSLGLAVISTGVMILPLVAELLLSLSRGNHPIPFSWIVHLPFALVGVLLLLSSLAYRGGRICKHKITSDRTILDSIIPPAPVLWLTMLLGLHGAADTTLFTWMPRFLGSTSFAWHPIPPGVVLSAYSLAYLVSRFLLAMVPETWGKRWFMVLPGLLGGAALLAGILSHHYILAAAGYVAGGFLWSTEFPAMQGILAEKSGRRLGMALALVNVPTGLLTFSLIQGTGLLASHVGEAKLDRAMLLPSLCFPLIGLFGLLWVRLFHQDSKPPAASLNTSVPPLHPPFKTIQENP